MSFAAEVKNELCRTQPGPCCRLAECYGALLYCNTFSPTQIRIVTEHRPFGARMKDLFLQAFGVPLEGGEGPDGPGKLILTLADRKKIQRVYSAFGYDVSTSLSLHVNLGLLEEDCCRAAFLRGAFLAGGSMIDPEKRYHFELTTSHMTVSREVRALLQDMGYDPKGIQRAGGSVVYFKQSEAIEELLTRMGAPVHAMNMMNTKLEKEVRNDVNRQVNCDTANLDKAVLAAHQQMEAIRVLQARGTVLPERLAQTAALRLENPEATLQELANLAQPPISKSAMNHRLRKLLELAAE